MPLPNRAASYFAKIHVALEGATLSDAGGVIEATGVTGSTTVGRDAKPSDADTAWVELHDARECQFGNDNGQAEEVWTGVPGSGLHLAEILRSGQKTTVKVTCQRLPVLSIQLLFNTLTQAASAGQWNPGAAPYETRAWLAVEIYDHRGVAIDVVDLWVDAVLDGGLNFVHKTKTDPVYMFTKLYSELNTGTNSPA